MENSVIISKDAQMTVMSDKELYQLCQECGRNIKFWKRKFAALLPEVSKRELYKKYGFYSIYEFAAKIGGFGKKTTEEILRIYRRVENKPLLKAEIEKEGWGKVRTVVSLMENLEEKTLVHMVETLPKRALEVAVRDFKRQESQKLTPPGWGCAQEKKIIKVTFQIDKETDFRLRRFQLKLEKKRKEKVPFNEVLKALLDEADGQKF